MRSIALAFLLLLARPAVADDVLTGIDRVVAVGDVHGDYDQLVAVLRSAGLLDAELQWSGGKTHLVQTGDILDRGPDSRKAMDLLMRLEDEAKKAGGEVHALIGNHEAMNVYGDLRYVSPGEIAAFRDADSEKIREEAWKQHQKDMAGRVPKFDDAYRKGWETENPLGFVEHRRAFGPAGKYGKWIRGHDAVLKIDGTLFLHGGISPKYAGWTVRRINDGVRAELEDFTKMEGGIVQDDEGPLWYRGLARGGEGDDAALKAALANFKVERLAVGHTYTNGAIVPRYGGRVLMIDVAMSKVYDPKGRVACLVLEKGTPHVLHRGKRVELPKDSDADLARYLKETAAIDAESRSK